MDSCVICKRDTVNSKFLTDSENIKFIFCGSCFVNITPKCRDTPVTGICPGCDEWRGDIIHIRCGHFVCRYCIKLDRDKNTCVV